MDFQLYSDLHKDVYGVRARNTSPTEADFQFLQSELESQLAEARKDEDCSINACMDVGAPDIDTAMRWLEEADVHSYWA
tara:strand:- start:1130 stop:1366 length:237 start_codon:yes stop_codon:yes gene_type:complete